MNKVTIDVEARFVDNVTGESKAASKAVEGIGKEAEKAQKKVDNLSKKKARPSFDADNNKFLNKIRTMEAKMAKLGRTKTAAVLHLVDKVSTPLAKILGKLNDFRSKKWEGLLRFKDGDALKTINKVTKAAEGLTKKVWTAAVKVKDMALAPLKAIKNALFSIPTLITAVVSAKVIQETIIKPINLADQYTSAKIGFSTLLGDSAGQAMMDEIDLFAKKTPFKTSGVISNAQKMMAYGWDVKRVISDMEIIGDAAAATGKGDQGLESIVRALAEIRSKGKLSTQELNQLAGAGIKAKAYLAEGLGYGSSDEGMMKLAEDLEGGAIGANQAIELILQGMKEFDGMMDRTANETVGGLKSQIEDAFEINIFRRWGQGLQDGAKKSFGSIVELLDKADEGLARFGDTLAEIGSSLSNWAADKLEKTIQRILEITDSYEFKNASLKEKISMLWKGVVADPVKEWWEGGAKEKVTETATNIGTWIGEALIKGFITAAGNVWNALPAWGKILVGGYVGGKTLGGIGNAIGGISNLIGGAKSFIGTTGLYGVGGSGVLGGLSKLGYGVMGKMGSAGSIATIGTTGGMAAAGGAGALTMAAGTLKAGKDFYDAYRAHKEGDAITRNAQLASGGTVLGAMGTGALIGSAFGGPVGTLIGGGIGALVGWVAGDAIAAKMESAKYESKEMKAAVQDTEKSAEELAAAFEKAKWENAKEHFGDIALSMDEIARLSEQIVWGDDLAAFEKFSSATKNAEANLQSMKNTSMEADRWMWKAGLGVRFNEDERKAFAKSFEDYINNAKSFLENKHYEFTASAELLLDLESEDGKSILEGGNAFYAAEQEKLDAAGQELGEALTNALADGIINADEEKAIIAAQQKIAEITNKINNAKTESEMELIKVKWGEGNLTAESFDNFMSTMETTLQERMANADEAFEIQVQNLKLRYPDGGEQYQKEFNALVNGYKANVDKIKADVLDVELNMIGEAYEGELGKDAADDLKRLLETSIKSNMDPIEIDDETIKLQLKSDKLSPEDIGNIKTYLSNLFNQVKIMGIDVEANVDVALTGVKNIQNNIDILASDFGIPESEAATILWNIRGAKTVPEKLDIIAKEFGINSQEAATVLWKITGQKNILNPFSLGMSDFGLKSNYWFSPTVNINPVKGSVSPVKKYRGGIVGGSSAMEGFARGGRPDDGMLKGSTRFIRVNEEAPEMIIPLSSQRRGRALKLWAKAGNIMGVPGFARGGMTSGGNDEGIRFQSYGSGESAGGQSVQVDIGGITFEITVSGNDPQSITAAIKAQANEIAETVAGVLADALGSQFENTPARGGIA